MSARASPSEERENVTQTPRTLRSALTAARADAAALGKSSLGSLRSRLLLFLLEDAAVKSAIRRPRSASGPSAAWETGLCAYPCGGGPYP